MNTTNGKRRHLITAVTLALVLAAPIPPRAEASQLRFYDLPMVDAKASAETTAWEFDALISGQIEDLLPRTARANNGSAFAAGEASTNEFWATAVSGGSGAAITRSYVQFVVRDPQARGLVQVNLSSKLASTPDKGFKGAVSVGPPPSRLSQSDATVRVRVVPGGGPYMISYTNDGWLEYIEYPEPPMGDYDVFSASAQAQCYNDGPDDAPVVKCQWQRGVYVNNRPSDAAEGSGGSVTLDVSPALSVRPGLPYLIAVEASTTFNAAAVIDPLLEPHPDNPDIVIEFPNAVADPNPLPMMAGITPAELLARGIDPQPFIQLGFLEASPPPPPPPPPPPSDGGGGSTPPPPPAPKYWCGPGFWLNNATNFGASAWPMSERTYYDYNATAGQLMGCPAATGNPTLLQVLQNPKPYFSTQLKDAGFNCVGDYLSGKSGLTGTMADNNGVCSIDQFGRKIQ